MPNLVTFSKFENKGSPFPTEQRRLCEPHSLEEEKKLTAMGYEKSVSPSSMPKAWCDLCHPEFEHPEYWGF